MFAWTRLVIFIAGVLDQLLSVYFWVVLVAVLMTWIEPNPYNPIVRFIYSITEPVFDWIRERLPVILGGIDLSPLVVVLAIGVVQRVVLPSLLHYLIVGAAEFA